MPVTKIQNTCDDSPTVCVRQRDPGWDTAYQNWLDGKNPTDSTEWKKGVFATVHPVSWETKHG